MHLITPVIDSITTKRIEEVLDLSEKIDRRQHAMLEAVRDGRQVSGVMHDKQFAAIHDRKPTSQAAATEPPATRSHETITREDEELVALFAQADTPGVSDALDKPGIPGQIFGLMPLGFTRKKTTVSQITA